MKSHWRIKLWFGAVGGHGSADSRAACQALPCPPSQDISGAQFQSSFSSTYTQQVCKRQPCRYSLGSSSFHTTCFLSLKMWETEDGRRGTESSAPSLQDDFIRSPIGSKSHKPCPQFGFLSGPVRVAPRVLNPSGQSLSHSILVLAERCLVQIICSLTHLSFPQSKMVSQHCWLSVF